MKNIYDKLINKVMLYVTKQWKAILYASRITKIELFGIYTSQNKSLGKHGKIRGMLYDLNISYIFCAYSRKTKIL